MSTLTIFIITAVGIALVYGLIKTIIQTDENNTLMDNMRSMDEEQEFEDFMEASLSERPRTSKEIQDELDLIESSFNLTKSNVSLDMTGLSGRSIVALKDLHVRDVNGLKQISKKHLQDRKGVGAKTIEDIQAWAMGSYNVEIK